MYSTFLFLSNLSKNLTFLNDFFKLEENWILNYWQLEFSNLYSGQETNPYKFDDVTAHPVAADENEENDLRISCYFH